MKTRRKNSQTKLKHQFVARQTRRPAQSSRPGGVRLAPVTPQVMRSHC
ncbi:MAG: hypothetical protein ACQEQL_03280 [Pseudomonadota bacterium]